MAGQNARPLRDGRMQACESACRRLPAKATAFATLPATDQRKPVRRKRSSGGLRAGHFRDTAIPVFHNRDRIGRYRIIPGMLEAKPVRQNSPMLNPTQMQGKSEPLDSNRLLSEKKPSGKRYQGVLTKSGVSHNSRVFAKGGRGDQTPMKHLLAPNPH